MQSDFMFTSESVTEGHPDKLCDQISDAVVGHFLRQDITARVAAECAISTGVVFLSVKYRSPAKVNVGDVARDVIAQAGYTPDVFDAQNCAVMSSLQQLPANGAIVLDERKLSGDGELDRLVAQDQATLFGFACNHTPALMPLPIWLAHRLARALDAARKDGLSYLTPDGKTQVGVEFRDRRPARIHSVTIIASQRAHEPDRARLERDLRDTVIESAFADEPLKPDARTRIAINPEGPIVPGGPVHHAGLTGRKTGVDTYGEFSRQSGAALSGKDPSRIDRVGAYAARHAARSVVAAGLAEQCEIALSYSVGLAAPVSVQVETYGTGRLSDDELCVRVTRQLDFRVGAIVRRLKLRELVEQHTGFYRRLAVYGHFGRDDLDLPWERSDALDALR
jgi:S-adenosylmethionine synthetase